ERRDRLAADEATFKAAREQALRTRRHQTAPPAAIEAIAAAASLPFDEGCRRERALSAACVRSEQARAMVYAFLAERGVARVPGLRRGETAAETSMVAVVGAGTMGAGIAMACANAGLTVTLSDVVEAALEKGLATIRSNYQRSVERGRLTQDAV